MKITKIAADPGFSNVVELKVRGTGDFDVNILHSKMQVSYNIDDEWRSWGLKGVILSGIRGWGEIEYEIQAYDDVKPQREGRFILDASKLPIETKSIGPSTFVSGPIEIYLTPDLQVDYSRSSITVVQPDVGV